MSEYEQSPREGEETDREETVEDLDVPEGQDESVSGGAAKTAVIDFKEIDAQ
jgi:hypothetical protein